MGIQRDDLDPVMREQFPEWMFAETEKAFTAPLPDSYSDALATVQDLYQGLADHVEDSRATYQDLHNRCDPDDGRMWRNDLREEMQWELDKAWGGMDACYSRLETQVQALTRDSEALELAATDLEAEALELQIEPEHPDAPASEQAEHFLAQARWLRDTADAVRTGDFRVLRGRLEDIYEELGQWREHRRHFEERAATIRQFSGEERPEDVDVDPDDLVS